MGQCLPFKMNEICTNFNDHRREVTGIKDMNILNKMCKTNTMEWVYEIIYEYKCVILFDIDDTFILSGTQLRGDSFFKKRSKHYEILKSTLELNGDKKFYFVTNAAGGEENRDRINSVVDTSNYNSTIVSCYNNNRWGQICHMNDTKYNTIVKLLENENLLDRKIILFVDDIDRHVRHFCQKCSALDVPYIGVVFDHLELCSNSYIKVDIVDNSEYEMVLTPDEVDELVRTEEEYYNDFHNRHYRYVCKPPKRVLDENV